jgi:hypothetical protein
MRLWVLLNATYGYSGNSDGQGVVYNQLVDYYRKDREIYDRQKAEVVNTIIIINPIQLRYKTSKSLKHPIRFKGWKGKR